MVPNLVSARAAITAAGFALAGFASATQAATVTFDFTTTSSGYEIKKNFLMSGLGLEGWANTVVINPDDSLTVKPAPYSNWQERGVAQWKNNGLGLKSKDDNSHTVDSSGLNDLLLLTFKSTVRIISASFNYAGVLTHSYDSFAFFADLEGDGFLDDAEDLIFERHDIGAVNILENMFSVILMTTSERFLGLGLSGTSLSKTAQNVIIANIAPSTRHSIALSSRNLKLRL